MLSATPLSYTHVSANQYCYDLKYGTAESAGLDLYLTNVDNVCIAASNGAVIGKMYGTNIAMEIPRGHVGLLYLRSSAAKSGFSMLNHVGVIDSDYRGEIKAMLYHADIVHAALKLPSAKPVLQLVIVPSPQFSLLRVDSLAGTSRGNDGFGSTDSTILPLSEIISATPIPLSDETFAATPESTLTPESTVAAMIAIMTSSDKDKNVESNIKRFSTFAEEYNFPATSDLTPGDDRVAQLKKYYEARTLGMRAKFTDQGIEFNEKSTAIFDPIGDADIIEDMNTNPLYKPAH